MRRLPSRGRRQAPPRRRPADKEARSAKGDRGAGRGGKRRRNGGRVADRETWTVRMGGRVVQLVFDMQHIAAHRRAFVISMEAIVALVGKAIRSKRSGHVAVAVAAREAVG